MRMWLGVALVLLGCRSSEPTVAPVAAEPAAVEPEPVAAAPVEAEPSPPPAAEDREAAERAEARAQYERAVQQAARLRSACRRAPARIKLDSLVRAYEVLAPYERSAERDEAIASLEACRRLAAAYVAQNLDDPAAGPALDYTAELQDAVREANARTTKRLKITVKGSKVTIDDKKGRRRNDKRTLEGYCARSDAPDADSVDRVTDDRGQMSCSSQFEFSKQSGYVDRRMGIATPFEVESTEGKQIPPSAEGEAETETEAEAEGTAK